jgi:hypothetical protein
MRKQIIHQGGEGALPEPGSWLDLERLASVEITSETSEQPIEAALTPGAGAGWQAAGPGRQTIRIVFDQPLTLTRIRLEFAEARRERTQEFVLRWLPAGASSAQEVLRQQFNFSPPDTTRELEDYQVELAGLKALELEIVPDMNRGDARASLAALRLA